MRSRSGHLEEAVYRDVATSLPCRVDGRSPGLCRTQVRWSLLQLQDAHPRFKPLKFGCHLASEEDLPLVPSKDIQGQSLFLPVQLYDWNIFRNLYLRELVRFPSTNSYEDKAQLQEIL